ncbi:hypothetical protein ACSBR1_021012 [Camellia fascicularis]
MGTLTSSSFSAVNLSLQWSPISSTSRKRIELFVRKSNCFLCKEVSKRHLVLNRNFARSWCFGANNNGDNDGDSSNNASNDSNLVTTTLSDEAEEKAQSNDDFDSDKSKPSISSRVRFFLSISYKAIGSSPNPLSGSKVIPSSRGFDNIAA